MSAPFYNERCLYSNLNASKFRKRPLNCVLIWLEDFYMFVVMSRSPAVHGWQKNVDRGSWLQNSSFEIWYDATFASWVQFSHFVKPSNQAPDLLQVCPESNVTSARCKSFSNIYILVPWNLSRFQSEWYSSNYRIHVVTFVSRVQCYDVRIGQCLTNQDHDEVVVGKGIIWWPGDHVNISRADLTSFNFFPQSWTTDLCMVWRVLCICFKRASNSR